MKQLLAKKFAKGILLSIQKAKTAFQTITGIAHTLPRFSHAFSGFEFFLLPGIDHAYNPLKQTIGLQIQHTSNAALTNCRRGFAV